MNARLAPMPMRTPLNLPCDFFVIAARCHHHSLSTPKDERRVGQILFAVFRRPLANPHSIESPLRFPRHRLTISSSFVIDSMTTAELERCFFQSSGALVEHEGVERREKHLPNYAFFLTWWHRSILSFSVHKSWAENENSDVTISSSATHCVSSNS